MATIDSGQKLTKTNQGKLSIEDINGRLLVTDANNRVILLAGYDDGGSIVVKLAQNGFDARTATDDQIVFSSEFDLFKIVHTDSFVVLAAAFANSGNSYLTKLATEIIDLDPFNVTNPIVWVFIENAVGDVIPLPYYQFDYNTGALSYQAIASVNTSSNDLYVEVRATAALSPGVTFRYYVLQQTSAS